MTGEDIMKDFHARKYGFLPAVISPYGMLGNMIDRFLYGAAPYPLPEFSATRKHAQRAARTAISMEVPGGILLRANQIWREQHPGEHYGSSYRAMDPLTSANQRLGQLVCVANGTHILHALEKLNGEPIPVEDDGSVEPSDDWIQEDIESDIATCPETAGFRMLTQIGEDSSESSHRTHFSFDSSSPTDMPAMP